MKPEPKPVPPTDRTLYRLDGKLLDPFALRPEDCTLDEIAWRLARRYRYAAAAPYTVAEHSIALAFATKRRAPAALKLQRAALLHDAAEAFLGDIPAPLKAGLTWVAPNSQTHTYAQAEAAARAAIEQRFRLRPRPGTYLVLALLETLLAREERVFFFGGATVGDRAAIEQRLDPYGIRRGASPPTDETIRDIFVAHAITLGLDDGE